MRSGGEPAVVTGLGAVTALGTGRDALWSAILEGRDGLRPVERFPTHDFATSIAGLVPGHDFPHGRELGALCLAFAAEAAREAIAMAGLAATRPAMRTALVFGTSLGEGVPRLHEVGLALARQLGLDGPCLTISTACCASTNAIGLGRDLLARGDADVVLAGGADVLTPKMFAGFSALGVLSRDKCAPFGEPAGTTLGEGAAFLVLERLDDARARGAAVAATVLGYGLSADAFHETSPDPTGAGLARALRAALEQAGVAPEEVGYANLHGTGTAANDPAEWRALRTALGPCADRLAVSASKSLVGHAQGAAGAIETVITILGLVHQTIAPTANVRARRPLGPPEVVTDPRARPHRHRIALKTSAAFGGANAALVLGTSDVRSAASTRRDVFVACCGSVGPRRAGAAGPDEVDPSRLLSSVDPRGLDPMTLHLTLATALALDDRECPALDRERTGLVVGQTRISPASDAALTESVLRRGIHRLSSAAFARSVLNAATGACARTHALKGPLSTLTVGPGSGLVAVAYAAELLSSRPDVSAMLAGGVDEAVAGSDEAEGAAIAVLVAAPAPTARVRIAGWGFGPPGAAHVALERAVSTSGLAPGAVDAWPGEGADLDASGDALRFVAAARALSSSRGGAIAIASTGAGSATCAIVLATRGE